jgi:hypothetical protein
MLLAILERAARNWERLPLQPDPNAVTPEKL